MKHTPGPWPINWYVCRDGNKELWRVPRSIGPVSVDHNHWAGHHLTLDEADAALIARAPEFRAALAWALDQIEDDLDPSHQAALAYARSLLKD